MSTVCIDFDGVLAQYDGWKGEDALGDPAPGALEFVKRLLDEGHTIAVHTTRPSGVIHRWLEKHGFMLDGYREMIYANREKPPALVYIDDRGFRFTGDWEAAYQAIQEPTWWEANRSTRADRVKAIGKAIDKVSHEDPTVFAALDLYLSGEAGYVEALETAVAALADEKTRFVQLVISLSAHQ